MSGNITLQAGDYVLSKDIKSKSERKELILAFHRATNGYTDGEELVGTCSKPSDFKRRLTPEQVLSATNAKSELDLAKERIAELEEAIEFACAPDMWYENADGSLDYRYTEWYIDVLKNALNKELTND